MTRQARAMTAAILAALGTSLAMAGAAAAAEPVTAGVFGMNGAIEYNAPAGTSNKLEISVSNGRWIIKDAGISAIAILDGGGPLGCSQGPALNVVSCYRSTGQGLVSVRLGDQNDTVRVDNSVPELSGAAGQGMWIYGEDGADTFVAGSQGGSGFFSGGLGNDSFTGGDGVDELRGGPGQDTFRGGAGADTIDGEEGRDTVKYSGEGRLEGVRAVLDGSTPSGHPSYDSGGDRLYGLEDVVGTPHTDVITGNASTNLLEGSGGADQINGLGGDDTLTAIGGPSWLDGGDGNDRILAKNGAKDNIACGAGTDTGLIDLTDLFLPFADCESFTN